MAELDTLKSYLISLGFAVDIASYRKMGQLLDQQKKMVMNSTGVMSNSYVKAGKTIAGVLIGVGAATVMLMDKVAKADLGYDLFGMKMYMTADAAKKVKIAVDALGYSMDEIAWNPELKKRFDQLIELQGGLQNKLGPDYKKTMREIRDIRFEFTKMKVEGEYMMQVFVYELFKKLGISAKDVHEILKRFNNWLIANMVPAMQKLADLLVNIWDIMQMMGPSVSGLARDMNRLLSSFHVGNEQAEFLDWLGSVAYVLSGLVSAFTFVVRGIILMARAMYAASSGNIKDIPGLWDEALEAWKDYDRSVNLERRGQEKLQNSGDRAAGVRRPRVGRGASGSWDSGASGSWGTEKPKASPGVSKFKDYLSQFFPGQEHVAAAIMKAESSGNPNAVNRNRNGTADRGLFQINDVNIPALKKAGIITGPEDLFDPAKNFQAAKFLYDRKGWQPWDSSKKNWEAALTSNTTNNVTVNVTQPGASADEIARAASRKLEDMEQRRRAREIRELAGVMG